MTKVATSIKVSKASNKTPKIVKSNKAEMQAQLDMAAEFGDLDQSLTEVKEKVKKVKTVVEEVKPEVVVETVIEVVEKVKTPKIAKVERVLTEEQKAIQVDSELSKSDKMRGLYNTDNTMTVGEISKYVDGHYSFVYGVIQKFKAGVGVDRADQDQKEPLTPIAE